MKDEASSVLGNPQPTNSTRAGEQVRDDAPISRDEMEEMFGSEMPIEAVRLLFGAGDDKTIGEVRAELREMARNRPSVAQQLIEKMAAPSTVVLELGVGGLFVSVDDDQRLVDSETMLEVIDYIAQNFRAPDQRPSTEGRSTGTESVVQTAIREAEAE